MKCPICELELENSRKVFNMSVKEFKKFHLKVAHFDNLVTDLLELATNIAWEHTVLNHQIPFGNQATKLHKYAQEIQNAEITEWRGENE